MRTHFGRRVLLLGDRADGDGNGLNRSTADPRLGQGQLWLGLGTVAAVSAVLRFWNIGAGLPQLATSDEAVVVGRADGLLHGHLPTLYDWPSGSMMILAGVFRVLGVVWPSCLVSGSADQYLVARLVSATAGVALGVIAGLIAFECVRPSRRALPAAWTASTLTAIAYTGVRMSHISHPEIEQAAFAAASILLSLRYLRRSDRWEALAAGALAGAAAAVKYIGGAAIIVVVITILLTERRSLRALYLSLFAGLTAAVVFISLVPATIFKRGELVAGIKGQFLHQAGGHLGYDSSHPVLAFHLTQSIPGSWGWPLTILAFVAMVVAAIRGSSPRRLCALYVAVTIGVLGASHVTFPHYILIALPILGVVASVELWNLVPLRRAFGWAVVGLLVLSLVPTTLNDLRFLTTTGDLSTQAEASATLAGLKGSIVTEAYTDDRNIGRNVGSIGLDPSVIDCHCYVVISSYMEDRYRADQSRYAKEVAVYDAVRQEGRVVAVIEPSKPLSYRWDLLPQWGMSSLPIFDRRVVGPKITVLQIGQ